MVRGSRSRSGAPHEAVEVSGLLDPACWPLHTWHEGALCARCVVTSGGGSAAWRSVEPLLHPRPAVDRGKPLSTVQGTSLAPRCVFRMTLVRLSRSMPPENAVTAASVGHPVPPDGTGCRGCPFVVWGSPGGYTVRDPPRDSILPPPSPPPPGRVVRRRWVTPPVVARYLGEHGRSR